MPYISIESGRLTAEQKKELNFGIGGKSIDDIKQVFTSK